MAKHADAAKVGVTLSYMDDDGACSTCATTGRASTPDAVQRAAPADGSGFGLRGDAPAAATGSAARLEIESAPGEGTAVNASVPAISPRSDDGSPIRSGC